MDGRVVPGKARLKHVVSPRLPSNEHEGGRAHNGTSRLRNQRKVRKPLAFSKARGTTAG